MTISAAVDEKSLGSYYPGNDSSIYRGIVSKDSMLLEGVVSLTILNVKLRKAVDF